MIFELLLTVSIRFFIFDFVLFKGIRQFLKKQGYFFRKLLGCPFCQGFWCGLGIFLAYHPLQLNWEQMSAFIGFGFISAYLGLITAAVFYPIIEKYEKNTGMPLQ